jgi:hypothetical protein
VFGVPAGDERSVAAVFDVVSGSGYDMLESRDGLEGSGSGERFEGL